MICSSAATFNKGSVEHVITRVDHALTCANDRILSFCPILGTWKKPTTSSPIEKSKTANRRFYVPRIQ